MKCSNGFGETFWAHNNRWCLVLRFFFKWRYTSALLCMRGFTLKIPFLLPGLTVLNFVQIHIFCVASARTSTFLQKSLLCWHLSHTLLWKTKLCSWTKVMLEVQQRFKTRTNKLPSLQPGSGISQNSMFTWTHPSKADRGQPQPGSHAILLAQHYLQIKFSLSSRTICWDTAQGLQLHCIFLSSSATKTIQKSSFTPRWEFKGRRYPQLWPQRSFTNKTKYTQPMAFQNCQWKMVSTSTDNVSSVRRLSQWKACQQKMLSTSREKLKPVCWSSGYILS